MWRYNFWFHCFFDNTKSVLTVLDGQKKYVLSVKESVWKMLCQAMKQVYVDWALMKKYGIEAAIITMLTEIWVLIVYDWSVLTWTEAHWFYWISKQPNKIDTDLSDESIGMLYQSAQHAKKQQCYYPQLSTQFSIYTADHAHDWKRDNWPMRWSTRQTWVSKTQNINQLLGYIQTSLLKQSWIHLPWGSAGWWYSVYGIIITQHDDVFVFHPLSWILWYASFPSISTQVATVLVPHPDYSWSGYSAMMVLAGDPSRCLKKYGNRWLRYLMMESGALWCLLRNALASSWYLEVWWWYEDRFVQVMDNFSVFSNNRKQLFTHLLLFV